MTACYIRVHVIYECMIYSNKSGKLNFLCPFFMEILIGESDLNLGFDFKKGLLL